MSWIWLSLAIVFEVIATLSLRASDGFRKSIWLIPIILGYAISFASLGFALSAGMAVGVAYGIWISVGVILVAFLARSFWGDPLTKRMLLGIVIIITGVLLVELGGSR